MEIRDLLALGGLVILVIGFFVGRWMIRGMHRRRLRNAPFPDEWQEIIDRNVPLYSYLPDDLKDQLHGLINVFLDEKDFEGCNGLELTDEICVTIAAQACVLLLNRNPTFYPRLDTILIYPSVYVAKGMERVGNTFIQNQESARLGESWQNGAVILAWDHVQNGAMDFRDGHNVVLHEFAHQLDQEDGFGDGTPILSQRSQYVTWARVLGHDYEELRDEVRHHKKDVMDAYGATNPAEFFAVATETFFEKPKQLHRKHPELYEELKRYYRMDPEQWR